MQPAIALAVYLIIFGLILIFISGFVFFQYLKVEKIARPFLLGLWLYFIFMAIVNLSQAFAYFVNPSLLEGLAASEVATIYRNYFSVSLIYIAPLLLVFQIEKTYFQFRLFAKFHVITILIIVLDLLFFIETIPTVLNNPAVLDNFALTGINPTTMNWFIIVSFICMAFLYLGIKSTGKYRLYSLIIFASWAANQLINAFGQFTTYAALMQLMLIIFAIKIMAAICTAYGFIKLYGLRNQ
ncbi:MAG: hypothetical protein ACTSRS_15520 [Candidatus Helarchaeota archaeon]